MEPQPASRSRAHASGRLPPDAPATGGIVAALVSSAYRSPQTPQPVRFQPPPSAPGAIALYVLRPRDGALLARDTLDGTHLNPYVFGEPGFEATDVSGDAKV